MSRKPPNVQTVCGPGGVPIRRATYDVDYMSRQTMPEVYPRETDPFRPPPAPDPGCTLPPGLPPALVNLAQCFTTPATRPTSVQRAANFQITVPAAPATISLANGRFECDSMLLDIPSTGANSAFIGYGAGVSTTNGIEIQPGLPFLLQPDNTREMWEIQRQLEFIAAMFAADRGIPCLAPYKAPRVVFNASEWFLTTTVAVVMSVTLFLVPELQ